jgi:hypothetical protein
MDFLNRSREIDVEAGNMVLGSRSTRGLAPIIVLRFEEAIHGSICIKRQLTLLILLAEIKMT